MNEHHLMYKTNIDTIGTDFNEYEECLENKVRQDYDIDIFRVNNNTEEEDPIGEIHISIFDLKCIQEVYDKDDEILAYDDEALTAKAYEAICEDGQKNFFNGYWGFYLHEDDIDKEGHLIYIKYLYIYENHRNKGYGSEVIQNLPKILKHTFNLDVRGLFGEAAPCIKNEEGDFEYVDEKDLDQKAISFFKRHRCIFLEKKERDHYFVKRIVNFYK